MVTTEAIRLSTEAQRYRAEDDYYMAHAAAEVFYNELFANCRPTEDEFVDLATGVIITARALWKLALYVPAWEQANESNLS